MPRNIQAHALFGMIALVLAGCVSPGERPPPHTTIATDQFSKTIDIVGPIGGENQFGGTSTLYKLVTRVDKQTHAYFHVIRAEVSFVDSPLNFVFAADDTAETLQLVRISRERPDRSCAVCFGWEIFDIDVPDAALRAHAATGYSIKASSRDGYSVILTISPAMIATQFAGLDEFLKTGAIVQH
jgi:hypothetical protein